ncbi:site-specific integrase [Paraburkholderia sp. RL18-085-BIA-A]|uniref:site-specific integrase n=1 Tax=Paraburkholderia sp. RL18-085-BIA-A TaxID=3031633 RepID=UPI0038BBF911
MSANSVVSHQSAVVFLQAIAALPPLPRVIVCEDDFGERNWSIRPDDTEEYVAIFSDGQKLKIHLLKFDLRIRPLIRYFTIYSLMSKSARYVLSEVSALSTIPAETIEAIATAMPADLRLAWPACIEDLPYYVQMALKSLVFFMCNVGFAGWSPLYRDFARRALVATQRKDNYAVVRSGDAFLSVHEEASLVRWIDETVLSATTLALKELELACLVVCSYQFGMRPRQLGILRFRDVSTRQSAEDASFMVHIDFRMLKQRDTTLGKLSLIRKVKREWAPLFVQLLNAKADAAPGSFLFGFSSRQQLSLALGAKFDEILPVKGRRAYDMRHSLAQRLVDSGASQEELAAALGHTDMKTGLVYFRASANQAELVNKALGISETFQTVARIAKDRFISFTDLAALKGDQQIGGMPHGIPIAGIGGCTTGQSACPFNPVTACYGCGKFMPVRDAHLHEQVLQDLRSVVHLYKDADKGQANSPAYLQLQRTIDEVQQVISQLEDDDHAK